MVACQLRGVTGFPLLKGYLPGSGVSSLGGVWLQVTCPWKLVVFARECFPSTSPLVDYLRWVILYSHPANPSSPVSWKRAVKGNFPTPTMGEFSKTGKPDECPDSSPLFTTLKRIGWFINILLWVSIGVVCACVTNLEPL